MPELPEVEIAARNLRAWAVKRAIAVARVDPKGKRLVRPHTIPEVQRFLGGARVDSVARIGKNLLVTLSVRKHKAGFLSHLGMTGKWVRRAGRDPTPPYSRIRIELDDGHVLHYLDPRLFGRLRLVPQARFAEVPEIAALGPDPLEQGIDVDRLVAALSRTSRPVKVAIMDQALIPGVGNIYASEALFRAHIDPRRLSRRVTREEAKGIARALLAAMRAQIAREMGPEITYVEEPGAENPFLVYDRAGSRCPRCKRGTITRVVLGQRSSFYCPACQK